MRILLLNPGWDRYVSRKGRRINRAWPPLDLLNCAALLEREGFAVELLDGRADSAAWSRAAAAAQTSDKVFVTSSPLDRWQCPNLDLEIFFERIRPLGRGNLHVMGAHGTHYPEMMLEKTGARAVIQGEPEWTVLELCRSKKPLSEISGLAYREAEKTILTASRPLGNLEDLPVPAFHLLDFDRYRYELLGERFALLETTRGCPFPCTFCMREMYGGKAYREKTPSQVAAEVEAALAAGARCGYFVDLEFTLKRGFVLELCRRLRSFAGHWSWCCQTRADSVDAEMLLEMKKAGCALIHFGVETGSPRVMKQIDKRITIEQIEMGVGLAKKAGIEAACFFMLGFPGESEAEREETLRFAEKLNPDYASFHIASPYPGTPLYAAGNWSEPYPETAAKDRDEAERLKRWEKSAWRRYYLRPGFALSMLRDLSPSKAARRASLFWNIL
ncbi:MAG: B12-binding domain-containing radical SAM protein [Elusimicrobiota bacterium]